MIPGDPNIAIVEMVAAALGDLREELVLVGGCAASLLIDMPTATPPRVTYDVDLLAEVTALIDYYALERRFSQQGFSRDLTAEAPVCRWALGAVKVDLMPTDASVLGFSNRWYAGAAVTATTLGLRNGITIKLITAPYFLATKFEAFHDRGRGDMLTSHDFEDVINIIEGRRNVIEEIASCDESLRKYLVDCFRHTTAATDFPNVLPGLIGHDALHGQRVTAVMKRIERVCEL